LHISLLISKILAYVDWVLQLEFWCDTVCEIKGNKMKRKEMIKKFDDFLQKKLAKEAKKSGKIVGAFHSASIGAYHGALCVVSRERNLNKSPKKTWKGIVAGCLFKNEKTKVHWSELPKENQKIENKIVKLEGQRKLSKHYEELEPSLERLHGD